MLKKSGLWWPTLTDMPYKLRSKYDLYILQGEAHRQHILQLENFNYVITRDFMCSSRMWKLILFT